ncbi:hypothetical protein KIP31_10020 [Xanthomonas campestris pv. campestris]|uniref:hypothetical protein n=1 Tax=Xanthomonas campestris TaxID=339 RepID=UPI001F3A231D|nr:hypothetical protein [Xanthomonas campestris]MCF8809653.1 hypothetical protein [Xanthomonas campestris pv. campestris]
MSAQVRRSAWARRQAQELRTRLDGIRSQPAIGDRESKRKRRAIEANETQMRKFERIAAAAERKGN